MGLKLKSRGCRYDWHLFIKSYMKSTWSNIQNMVRTVYTQTVAHTFVYLDDVYNIYKYIPVYIQNAAQCLVYVLYVRTYETVMYDVRAYLRLILLLTIARSNSHWTRTFTHIHIHRTAYRTDLRSLYGWTVYVHLTEALSVCVCKLAYAIFFCPFKLDLNPLASSALRLHRVAVSESLLVN